MTALFAISVFVPSLLLIVVIHELGHFIMARLFKVKVLGFGVGFPPAVKRFYRGRTTVHIDMLTEFINCNPSDVLTGSIVNIMSYAEDDGDLFAHKLELPMRKPFRWRALWPFGKPKKERDPLGDRCLKHTGKVLEYGGAKLVVADMVYSINLLPIGGFVELPGMDDERIPGGILSKGVGTRLAILAAGAGMNFILAIALFTAAEMIPRDILAGDIAVRSVIQPAKSAGVLPGDIIQTIDGTAINRKAQIKTIVSAKDGESVTLGILREGTEITIQVTPESTLISWHIGMIAEVVNGEVVGTESSSLAEAALSSVLMPVLLPYVTVAYLIENGFSGDALAGPIGMGQATGEHTSKFGISGWLEITALISLSVGIMNLLPIPLLDGGHMAFAGLEWVCRGRRWPRKTETYAAFTGLFILLSLFITATFLDITRLMHSESILGG